MKNWSEDEIDAIAEVMNVGVGHASGALSELAQAEIKLDVPSVVVVDPGELTTVLGQDIAGRTVSVSQNFQGEFSGTASLLFLEVASEKLVEMMVGSHAATGITPELEAEALEEIGNIVLNACLGAIADMFALAINIDLPMLMRGDTVRSVLPVKDMNALQLLLVSVQLRSEPEGIGGLILLTMKPEQTERLRTLLHESLYV